MKSQNALILLGGASLVLYLLKDKIAAAFGGTKDLGYGAAFIPGPLDKFVVSSSTTTTLNTETQQQILNVQAATNKLKTAGGLTLQGVGAWRMNEIEKIAKTLNPEYASSPNATLPALAFTMPRLANIIPQVM
jgi:hypothetical protein